MPAFDPAIGKFGLPRTLAIVAVFVLVTILLLGLSGVLADSVRRFSDSGDFYQSRISRLVEQGTGLAEKLGIEVLPDAIQSALDPGTLIGFFSSIAESILQLLSRLFVILLIVIFMLFEAHGFSRKIQMAYGDDWAGPDGMGQVAGKVYDYLSVKAAMSLLTAAGVIAINLYADVDFVALWALVAFLFNFVPSIGSIIAAIPPVLLAMVEHGPGRGMLVALGYLIVNVGIGNIIEPKLMGEKLGLSPMVVILSLFFWAWVLGPVGMVWLYP